MNSIDEYVLELITNSSPGSPIWNIEKNLNAEKPKWNYIDGCVLLSFVELYKATGTDLYYDFVKDYIDFYITDDVPIGYNYEAFNLDNINKGKVLFFLYRKTKNSKYKKVIDLLYKQIQNQPRTKESNFWHKLIYPNQIWLDGLYMSMPFYTMYETDFNKMGHYKDIYTQITNIRKLMFNEQSKLYYHGYDSSREAFWADKDSGLSKNYWLRSIGWFAAAMVDTLDEMDTQMFFEYRAIRNQFKELIDGMIPYLSPNNMWYQIVDKSDVPGNYLETSGSAMLAYSIIKAVRIEVLPKRYLLIGIDIFNSINELKFHKRGKGFELCDICLVAGLGPSNNLRRDGSIDYYLSEKVVRNDGKGIAPFLLAYAELIKLQQIGENNEN